MTINLLQTPNISTFYIIILSFGITDPLLNFEPIRGSLMMPKWLKLASLHALLFQFWSRNFTHSTFDSNMCSCTIYSKASLAQKIRTPFILSFGPEN